MASSLYQIGYLISSLLIGYISDRYGRKPAFKLVILLDLCICALQAFAPTIHVYLIGQVFLGISAYGRFLTGLLLSTAYR
jgi:MFS family permease